MRWSFIGENGGHSVRAFISKKKKKKKKKKRGHAVRAFFFLKWDH